MTKFMINPATSVGIEQLSDDQKIPTNPPEHNPAKAPCGVIKLVYSDKIINGPKLEPRPDQA